MSEDYFIDTATMPLEYYQNMKKEIEKLQEENTILKQTMCNNSLLINENVLLNSIIKEANEYIADRVVPDVNNYNIEFELKLNTTVDEFIRHLSEILDKVEKVGEE